MLGLNGCGSVRSWQTRRPQLLQGQIGQITQFRAQHSTILKRAVVWIALTGLAQEVFRASAKLGDCPLSSLAGLHQNLRGTLVVHAGGLQERREASLQLGSVRLE